MTREDIKKIKLATSCSCNSLKNIDVSSTTSTASLAVIEQNTTRENWDTIAGNSIAFTYYPSSTPGSDPDNPSGNAGNIQTIEYSDGGGVVFTKTYTYNTDDLVVSLVVT